MGFFSPNLIFKYESYISLGLNQVSIWLNILLLYLGKYLCMHTEISHLYKSQKSQILYIKKLTNNFYTLKHCNT